MVVHTLVLLVPFLTEIAAIAISPNTTTSNPACPTTSFDELDPFSPAVVVECERSGAPTHSAYWNPYTAAGNNCSSSWDSESENYFATAPITTTVDGIQTSVLYDEPWSFVPTTPCCLNCSIFGGTVQVYYWATPAPSPPVSILVDSANNFTFISPSVYVAFQSLYATDLCGDLGQRYTDTTIGFDEGVISTCMAFSYATSSVPLGVGVDIPEVFTQAQFGEQSVCENFTSTYTDPYYTIYFPPQPDGARIGIPQQFGLEIPYTFNPCSPWIAFPSKLSTLNSLWAGCLQGVTAFWDPPYTLTPGSGLTPFTPAANNPAGPSPEPTDPAPGATPKPGSAKPTDSTSTPNDLPSPSSTAKATDPQQPAVNTNSPAPNNSPSLQQPAAKDPPAQQPTATTTMSDPPTDQSPPPDSHTLSPPSSNSDPQSRSQPQPPANPTPEVIPSSSSTITASSASTLIFKTQSISSSGPLMTISSFGNSVGTNEAVTSTLSSPISPSPTTTNINAAPVQVKIGSETLIAGGSVIMVSGTIFSLDPSGSSIIIGGSTTENLAVYLGSPRQTTSVSQTQITSGTTTSTMGLGGIIASLGGFTTPTSSAPSTTSSTPFTPDPPKTQGAGGSQSNFSAEPTSEAASATPTGSITCGTGMLVCQVEDPTRLEAPWHGVSAAFPQCYDPTIYTCSENFLCPIKAPKVSGEYACGPYTIFDNKGFY